MTGDRFRDRLRAVLTRFDVHPTRGLPSSSATRAYILAVIVAGSAVFATALARTGFEPALPHSLATFVLGAVTIGLSLLNFTWPHGTEKQSFSLEQSVVIAMQVTVGAPAAMVAGMIGSILVDSLMRKVAWKTAFNASQYVVSLGAAAVVLGGFDPVIPPGGAGLSGRHVLPVLGASLAFFVTNETLVARGISLATGRSFRRTLMIDARFKLSSTAVVNTLVLVVLAVLDESPLLLGPLALPIFAVYRFSELLLEKDLLAHTDTLTGLPNRLRLREDGQALLAAPDMWGPEISVLLVDLDGFKEVNDTLGHTFGDRLLAEIGPRLREGLREQDTVARIGGDEFAVLLPGVAEVDAAAAALRLAQVVRQPFRLADMELEVGCSIGVATFPVHGSDIDQLLQRADVAMYHAKGHRSDVAVYSSEHDPYSAERLALLSDLRRAVAEEQLVLHYQPKVDLVTGRATGAEALVRWQHPVRGLLAPGQFLPHAERMGIDRDLTAWVLRAALGQARAWKEQGLDLAVAVNLGDRTVHDAHFPREVQRLLQDVGVDPRLLELEITERTVMEDSDGAAAVLAELRGLGVRLALDDFGTGYSSLAYLQRLPIDVLKIDRSFIFAMDQHEGDDAVVRSIIDLARHLRLATVAEGVETEAAARHLRRLGCDIAQGYHFARPIPPDELARWVVAHDADAAEPLGS